MIKKNLLKIIIFGLLLSLLGFRIWQATGCVTYRSFAFDSQRIAVNVQTSREFDNNPGGLFSKSFHNKVTAAPYEFLLNFSALFDPRFLLDLVGPLVLLAVIIAVYNIVTQKIKSGFILLAALLIACLWITLSADPKTDMLILCALWFSLSFWSLNFFTKNKVRLLVFALLWSYSLWFFFITWQLAQFCNEIFFN